MLTEEHLALRRQHITGTDAAIIMGIKNEKRDVLSVYHEKRGEAAPDNESNIFMRYGSHCESFVRDEFLRLTGQKLRDMPEHSFFQHPEIPYIGGSVDAITDDVLLVEIKCPNPETKWRWGESYDESPTSIPENYGFQVQHYCLCTGIQEAVLVAYFGGDDLRVYPVKADAEIQEDLKFVYEDFWHCVQVGREPVHLLDMSDMEDVRRRYRFAKNACVRATPEILSMYGEAARMKVTEKKSKDRLEELKAGLCAFLGENDTLLDDEDNILLTWKKSKPRSAFNQKRFQQEHPELYQQYMETAAEGTRTALFKADTTCGDC